MSSPSALGDLGYQVTAVFPLSTSTDKYYNLLNGSSTGTKKTTSRTFDLARRLHFGTTGGKPLDSTIHPAASGPPRFKSLTVAIPFELELRTSGAYAYFTVAHLTRSSTAGAGSTWETVKTDVRRYRSGTSTASTFHTGFASSVNCQAIKRYWKANITFAQRLASDTSAKDTTTGTKIICHNPAVILSGGDQPQNVVPAVV